VHYGTVPGTATVAYFFSGSHRPSPLQLADADLGLPEINRVGLTRRGASLVCLERPLVSRPVEKSLVDHSFHYPEI
jgi:hypothetical protein